ncbi:MAG: hypothetical protein ACLP8S_07445 [Solirubrobacteraceae bacterium]
MRTGGYRRRFLIAACCVLALVTGLLTVGTLYILSLPGVGDAAARVERILALHHGIPGGVPPPHKLAAAVVAVEDEHLYSNFLINVLDAAGRAARGARRWMEVKTPLEARFPSSSRSCFTDAGADLERRLGRSAWE